MEEFKNQVSTLELKDMELVDSISAKPRETSWHTALRLNLIRARKINAAGIQFALSPFPDKIEIYVSSADYHKAKPLCKEN